MTREFEILESAQNELRKATWAGALQYADEGNFDDLKIRDEFVIKQVGEAIKLLEKYVSKVRPVQNNRRRVKSIFKK